MAYPPTLTDLQNDVLSRLSETDASHAGDFLPGDNSSTLITTKDTITQYLNEAQEDLARSCYPVLDYGTVATPTGTQSLALSGLTVPSGNSLWVARGVSWNGQPLQRCSRSALEVWYPTWVTDVAGTPAYWYDQGEDGIGLYPRPSSTQTTLVNGLAVPARLVNGTDTPSWLQADRTPLLVWYACWAVAAKNIQNDALSARGPVWRQEYEAGKAQLLARLWARDAQLAAAHFGAPPAAGGGAGG